MDRRQLKITSVLLALLMLFSPIASVAMQPAMSDFPPGHCEEMETDARTLTQEALDHTRCMIEGCAENCGTSRYCSSPAPVILTLQDTQIHFAGRDFAIAAAPDPHLFIHLSGLYRPPRA